MKRIFVTGDTHKNYDLKKLNKKNFDSSHLSKEDVVIICGDFGFVWDKEESKSEKYWLKWLNKQNFTVLFVDGNHENHIRLNEFPIELWKGGKVHKIRENVIHLMRGQVFNINNKKIFTMGGAQSVDKKTRIDGLNWWKEEMPSREEYDEAILNLDKYDYQVDYIISHCSSFTIESELYPNLKPEENELTSFMNNIYKAVDFKHAYCGHYHMDKYLAHNVLCLYNKIIEIK